MFKVDLHTHSSSSHDGGITSEQYEHALESGALDCIAVTDHGRIDMALSLHDKLGEKIIVGEEIMTTEGEIIGLFLTKPVLSGLSLKEAVQCIKDQDGIVYVPHPFETVRKGLQPEALKKLGGKIDIIEVCNGRAFFQNKSQKAYVWSRLNHIPGAGSSDAHGRLGLGKTYTSLSAIPHRSTLMPLMKHARVITGRPPLRSIFYPKYHLIRNKLGLSN